jgi:hypothetical protein
MNYQDRITRDLPDARVGLLARAGLELGSSRRRGRLASTRTRGLTVRGSLALIRLFLKDSQLDLFNYLANINLQCTRKSEKDLQRRS